MERGAAISRTLPQWMKGGINLNPRNFETFREPTKQEEAMKPTIGRIVTYTLSATDAEQINRRRTTSRAIADRVSEGKWPIGAQAHVGNEARAGQDFPMMITSVWPSDQGSVNGQVFLDGNDVKWVTSACVADTATEGKWRWPERA